MSSNIPLTFSEKTRDEKHGSRRRTKSRRKVDSKDGLQGSHSDAIWSTRRLRQ